MKLEMLKVLGQLEIGLMLAAKDESNRWHKAKLLLALRQVQKAKRHISDTL